MTIDSDAGTRQPLANAPSPQVTPTYDGSGEAVHPDVVLFANGWRGWEYWLVMTPYPSDDTGKENPSILVSHDGASWQEPIVLEGARARKRGRREGPTPRPSA